MAINQAPQQGLSPSRPDIRGAEPALHRAAQAARRIAKATNTPLVIWQDGKIVRMEIK